MLNWKKWRDFGKNNNDNTNLILANSLDSIRQYLTTRTDKELVVETDFYKQIIENYRIWQQGGNNLVSPILDMQVGSASNYEATINFTQKSAELKDILNYWKDYVVNSNLSNIATGLNSVYREWLTESWGSRLCIFYVVWGESEIPLGSGKKYIVPIQIYVPNAYGVKVIGGNTLGDKEYYFRQNSDLDYTKNKEKNNSDNYKDNYLIQYKNPNRALDKSEDIKIPLQENHSIYVRAIGSRSYENYPTPYLFHRGTAALVKVKEALIKSDYRTAIGIINDILLITKGSEELTKQGISYGEKELESLRQLIKTRLGTSQTFLSTYDTQMKHISPDVSSLLSRDKYFEVDKDILASLGLINIRIEGERRESELNYKGWLVEVQGVAKIFKEMIERDVYLDFVKRNIKQYPELFKDFPKLIYAQKPMNIWLSEEGKRLTKTWYSYGLLSKESAIEMTTDVSYEVEKINRENEAEAGDDTTMYPPIIQNQEDKVTDTASPDGGRPSKPVENKPIKKEKGDEK